MPPRNFLRPYAALAIITHAFDVNHLDITLIFKFPMDQTVKPANAKWIVEVDSVVKAVTASAWQDEFTMLLTTEVIAALPTKVTVEYDGPDPTLRTTWFKQWEPWGPILSDDSTLLPFGSFKGNEIALSQVAAQNVWNAVFDAGITVGQANKMLYIGNGQLLITVAGFYTVSYYLTIECSIANKHILTTTTITFAPQLDGRQHHEFARANEEVCISGHSIQILAVGNIINVAFSCTDPGNPTISITHVGIVINKIGEA